VPTKEERESRIDSIREQMNALNKINQSSDEVEVKLEED
jgi:hypothetical protein